MAARSAFLYPIKVEVTTPQGSFTVSHEDGVDIREDNGHLKVRYRHSQEPQCIFAPGMWNGVVVIDWSSATSL